MIHIHVIRRCLDPTAQAPTGLWGLQHNTELGCTRNMLHQPPRSPWLCVGYRQGAPTAPNPLLLYDADVVNTDLRAPRLQCLSQRRCCLLAAAGLLTALEAIGELSVGPTQLGAKDGTFAFTGSW